ncbi:hypothetical protein AAGF08_08845 [Algoriphagus sp. SE2]|uniref:hypothetical protein n=1 Tax=Algoriphagus sp. SE2 TaxID=3141536 RepID=UPI0031CCF152
MKKRPNKFEVKGKPSGKLVVKGRSSGKGRAQKHKVAVKARRSSAFVESTVKYADGLVKIYNREEEDIDRFADFARSLMPR